MRTRVRALPRPLPIAILMTFALALVLGAMPVDAAPKGSTIRPTAVALTEIVSPGQDGAFQSSFTNTGNPTITDLGLTVQVTAGGTLANPLPLGCTRTSPVAATCAVGTVSSGAPTITHLFFATANEPASGTTAPLTLSATYSGDSQQNNPNAAKRDTWTAPPATATVDTSAEVFGGWQDPHGATSYPAIAGSIQTTQVDVPAIPNGYPALVRHLNEAIDCGPGPALAGFGRTVELRVNNGNSPVEVTITYTAAANAPNPSQIEIVHLLDTGTCVFPVEDCAENPDHQNGCFDVFTIGTGRNKVTVIQALLPSNGRVRGG